MTGLKKWVVIPGAAAIVVAAVMMSAYAGSQTSAVAQSPAAKETATAQANREAAGKAKPGPWAYSGASGYTNYIGGGVGRSPVQPVKFPHTVHVNSLKMNCVFCHSAAFKSSDPGLPAVGTVCGNLTGCTGERPTPPPM